MSPEDVQLLLLDNVTTVATTAGLLVTAVVAITLLVRCRSSSSSSKSGEDGAWWNEANSMQKGKRNNESKAKKLQSSKKTKAAPSVNADKQSGKPVASKPQQQQQSEISESKRPTNQSAENTSSSKAKSKKQNLAGNKTNQEQKLNKLEATADEWTVAVSKKKKSKKDNEDDNVDAVKPVSSSVLKSDDKVPVAQVPEYVAHPITSEIPVITPLVAPQVEVPAMSAPSGGAELHPAAKAEFEMEPDGEEAEEEDAEMLLKERNRLRREKKKARNKKGAEQVEEMVISVEDVSAVVPEVRSLADSEIKKMYEDKEKESTAALTASKTKKKSKNKSTKKEDEKTVEEDPIGHSQYTDDVKHFKREALPLSSGDAVDRLIHVEAASSVAALSSGQPILAASQVSMATGHGPSADNQSDASAVIQSQQGIAFDELQELSVPEQNTKLKKKKARKDL